jgi:ribokinase
VLICVVGDCTLDVTVGQSGPMSAGDSRARIALGPGGQGANVSVRLARAGIRVRLVAPLADDPAGSVLRAHLERESVEVAALPVSRTSLVVVLVATSGVRTMISDRVPVDADVAAALRDCDWIHLSGYVLRDWREAERLVAAVRASGVDAVSVGGGSFEGWKDAAVAREAIAAIGCRLLVVNRDEAGLLLRDPIRTAAEAAAALGTAERLAVVTDGDRGSAAAGAGLVRTLVQTASSTGQPSIDTTGAGDAFTASLIADFVLGWPPDPEAVASALEHAALAGAAATTAIGAQALTDEQEEVRR